MAKQGDPKPKVKLPAIGKPKPKPKKTSARDLGKVANKQFKAGARDKDKETISIAGSSKITAKRKAELNVIKRKQGADDQSDERFIDKEFDKLSNSQIAARKRKLARITGV